ncbi:DUF6268 family outer membrane beta-barrel protein [Elizabethkingia miricola]|uniref:DUF6268 family outer membrane beta-barrel protein n=1 Tax=Elizabethkingia miricola TaxID=172045 RepID=UPI000B34E635|nr:DUF6268 family outer membrane beta-barrel protein [Elizabethkingia miricola]NHQ66797.1 hypothetical protein [Elizabethkingia miricola]NHQ70485.1 hypothetical protein [Elizabethkingia miricola]NHQ77335.1 hypothetical protein [Elizabethkingia miricola]PSL88089.1 hypothetical protein C7V10_12235 [Elizabethkingia miricola]QHQ85960.1 hypothetical protein FE632_03800 [Elizabethkingia miricola]
MRKKWIIIAALFQAVYSYAQIELRSEYLPKQKLINDSGDKTGGKSAAFTTSFTATIPVSVQPTAYPQPKIWAATLNASYTSFSNEGVAAEALPKEIGSADLGVLYMTPIHQKLTFVGGISAGLYTTDTNLKKLDKDNIIINVYSAFIWEVRPKIKAGIAIVGNNAFDKPMLIPVPYFVYHSEEKSGMEYHAELSYNPRFSIGYRFNDAFALRIVNRPKFFFAPDKIDGKKKYFDHHYVSMGLEPEYRINNWTISGTFGANFGRTDRYRDREPEQFLKWGDATFDPSFYISAGIKYNFDRKQK